MQMKTIRRNSVLALSLGALLLLWGTGCADKQGTAADDKQIRSSMTKKTFDINDVPAEQRDRVRGFMAASKNGPPPAPPAAGGTSAAPKP